MRKVAAKAPEGNEEQCGHDGGQPDYGNHYSTGASDRFFAHSIYDRELDVAEHHALNVNKPVTFAGSSFLARAIGHSWRSSQLKQSNADAFSQPTTFCSTAVDALS